MPDDRGRRGFRSKKFTGTKGEMEAVGNPALFAQRYMDNRRAEIESFVDPGVDTSMTDAGKEDLAVAAGLSPEEWRQYAAHYRKLGLDTTSVQWLKSGCVASWAFQGKKRSQQDIDAAYAEMWDRPGTQLEPVPSDKPMTTKEAAFLTAHEVGLENMALHGEALRVMPGSRIQKQIQARIAENDKMRRKARLSRS